MAACAPGAVVEALAALRVSPLTARAKAKFILANDGSEFEAEDIASRETIACRFVDFTDHFAVQTHRLSHLQAPAERHQAIRKHCHKAI
ncbi:type IIL restriction-modification enzyme MmeI [Paracoccus sp. 228]|uniref:type IIL restriction-modification enzyme MmeI n=1 Tax=Paracoccus sp. 228 TaxID=1192054 RepID=UPI00350FAD27